MIEPSVARRTWRTLEPIHGMVYFAEEIADRYEAAGLRGFRMGYFASRSAAFGEASAEVVIATFFNFHPDVVRRAIPAAWTVTTPARVLEARLDVVDAALRRAWGDGIRSPEVVEAAGLARRAAEAACEHPEGRALFAAHASLPWPDEPHLVLWHAQTLLREHRGDGHIAALLLEGLTGLEALVTHAASGDVPADVLRTSRAWSPEEWSTGVDAMRSRGVIAAGDAIEFTDLGAAMRQRMEDATDAASAPAYDVLGEDGCARLRELGRPLSLQIIESGLLRTDPSRYIDDR